MPSLVQLARTIEALMRRTSAADLDELSGHCSSCAIDADVGVVRGGVLRSRKGFDGLSAKIDLLYCRPIFGFQIRQDFANTGTRLILKLHLIALAPLGGELIDGAGARCGLTIVVGDGVPEDSVEPCDGTLLLAQLRFVLHRLKIGHLQYVFGGGRIADPA